VSQDHRRVEVYRRQGESEWSYRVITEGAVEFASLDVSLDVDAIYHDPLGATPR